MSAPAGDEMEHILVELAAERRALKYQEWAELDHRVTDHSLHTLSIKRRRERIRQLEQRRDDLASADNDWRPAA